MKEIIHTHSALTPYRPRAAVDRVVASKARPRRRDAASSESVEAAKPSSSARAEETAPEEGKIDPRKVEALKRAMAAGTLKFDSQVVAERMIDQDE